MQPVTSGRPINQTHAFDELLIYKPFKQHEMFVLIYPNHYVVMTLIMPRPLWLHTLEGHIQSLRAMLLNSISCPFNK
jgi:hypothetical protein